MNLAIVGYLLWRIRKEPGGRQVAGVGSKWALAPLPSSRSCSLGGARKKPDVGASRQALALRDSTPLRLGRPLFDRFPSALGPTPTLILVLRGGAIRRGAWRRLAQARLFHYARIEFWAALEGRWPHSGQDEIFSFVADGLDGVEPCGPPRWQPAGDDSYERQCSGDRDEDDWIRRRDADGQTRHDARGRKCRGKSEGQSCEICHRPRRITSSMMLRKLAPRAMRTPISWVRRPVACASTA